MTRLLQFLLNAAEASSRVVRLPTDELVDVIYRNATQRFPNLFDPRFNTGPARCGSLGPKRRTRARRRSRLAVALGYLLGLDPMLIHRCQFDEKVLRRVCYSYVDIYSINSVPFPGPPDLYSLQQSQHRTTREVCRRLMEAHSRANDNELFLFVGRIPSDLEDLTRLEDTLRLIRGAHHRVLMIDAGADSTSGMITDVDAKRIIDAMPVGEVATRFDSSMEGRLAAPGVKLAQINDAKLLEKVAMEIELIRSGRARMGASR